MTALFNVAVVIGFKSIHNWKPKLKYLLLSYTRNKIKSSHEYKRRAQIPNRVKSYLKTRQSYDYNEQNNKYKLFLDFPEASLLLIQNAIIISQNLISK